MNKLNTAATTETTLTSAPAAPLKGHSSMLAFLKAELGDTVALKPVVNLGGGSTMTITLQGVVTNREEFVEALSKGISEKGKVSVAIMQDNGKAIKGKAVATLATVRMLTEGNAYGNLAE